MVKFIYKDIILRRDMMIRRVVGSLIAFVLVLAIIFFILITPKSCDIYKTHGKVNIEKYSEGVIVYNDINYSHSLHSSISGPVEATEKREYGSPYTFS